MVQITWLCDNLLFAKLRRIGLYILLFSTGAGKPSKPASNVKSVKDDSATLAYRNPEKFVEEILDKTSALLLSEVTTHLKLKLKKEGS